MRLPIAAGLFVVGIVIAFGAGPLLQDSLSRAALFGTATGLIILLAILVRSRQQVAVVAALLIVILGIARVAAVDIGPATDRLNVPEDGEPVQVEGWLTDDARRAGGGVRLNVKATRVNDQPADFTLTVFASGLSDRTGSGRSSTGFRYGDLYEFEGRFSAGATHPDETRAGVVFTGVVDLVGGGHGNSVRGAVAATREWISSNLGESLSEPAASLGQTMLVNDRTGLSNETNLDFRESGTSHLLAISGLHVVLIGGLALGLASSIFGRRGQYYLLIPLSVTIGYAALAGFSPSVTRAAIMFSVALLARAIGRQNASLPAIGMAAAAMVLITPDIIRSISFQLSFAAISGIALLTPRLQDIAARIFPSHGIGESDGNRLINAAVSSVAVSIAATLATWPLIAVNFGGAPVWGGLATILVLPAVPLLIVTSAIAALVTGLDATLGEIVGWPAWLLAEYIVEVAALFRSIPPGIIDTAEWSVLTAVVFYTAVALAFWWRPLTMKLRPRAINPKRAGNRHLRIGHFAADGVPTWSVLLAVVAAVIAWTGAATAAGTDELEVTFFETERGDMILIRTPNGSSALIDGGRDPFGAVRRLDAALPFWDRSLDLLLVTHPDADHIGGTQAVLERYEVANVAEAPVDHPSTVHAAWRRAIEEWEGHTWTVGPGTVIALDDEITLEVLSSGPPFPDASINDASIVTMLRYRNFSMLLTGDITSLVERRLLESGHDLRATVLKVPHHGSDTSSTQQFLDAVDPEMAIVQVGTDNRFGHPTSNVMERLRSNLPEDRIYITSEHGEVTVKTDGRTLKAISRS